MSHYIYTDSFDISPLDYGCGISKSDLKPTVPIHRCPLCKQNTIVIKKDSKSGGMDGGYEDWTVKCHGCYLVSMTMPADDFYGRNYYKTIDDAITEWNKICEKYDKKEESDANDD